MSVPSDRSRRPPLHGGVAALLACCLLAASGCKAKQAGETSEPGSQSADEVAADPLAELAALEGQMRELGLEPGTGAAAPAGGAADMPGADAGAGDGEGGDFAGVTEDSVEEAPAPEPADSPVEAAPVEAEADVGSATKMTRSERRQAERCDDLCSLNEAICTLEANICALAEDHGDNPTYADACGRASEDCEISSQACDACAC